MKLTFAIALILAELGVGVLLMLPLIPIGEVRKSFFTFHSMLAAVCFALAAGVNHFELDSMVPALGLSGATVISIASFAGAHMEKAVLTRALHGLAALVGFVFGIVLTVIALGERIDATHGLKVTEAILVVVWTAGALLGAVLLGTTHNAMGLGHWYLISRNLSFAHLIRVSKILLGIIGVRTLLLVAVLLALPHIAPLFSQPYLNRLYSVNGDLMFFLMRILWGLGLPAMLALMSWRCAVGRANQAATGLLYLCEVSVLFGELFAAYLMV